MRQPSGLTSTPSILRSPNTRSRTSRSWTASCSVAEWGSPLTGRCGWSPSARRSVCPRWASDSCPMSAEPTFSPVRRESWAPTPGSPGEASRARMRLSWDSPTITSKATGSTSSRRRSRRCQFRMLCCASPRMPPTPSSPRRGRGSTNATRPATRSRSLTGSMPLPLRVRGWPRTRSDRSRRGRSRQPWSPSGVPGRRRPSQRSSTPSFGFPFTSRPETRWPRASARRSSTKTAPRAGRPRRWPR